MRRKVLLFAGVALCALGGVAFKIWPPSQPNILVITLDTTRADRLGCYGHAAARTPHLDSLASAGVLFEKAYTVAPLTLPAHASLFTGLYPAETGVRTNSRGRLDNSIPNLAQHLARNGYDTGGFVAAIVLDKIFGLNRGFKTYDDEFASSQPGVLMFGRRRPGDQVTDAALAWLKKKRSEPFFCWVHLFDPHLPYLSHPDAVDDGVTTDAYDAQIAFADRQVGRLLAFLRDHNLTHQTLIVVVGDHGEGLGEHGEATHSLTLYNSVLRVPLIWSRPGHLPAGRRVTSNVSLVDIYPTILDELGLKPPQPVAGRSLRAALSGADTADSVCFGATDEPFLQYRWSPLRTLIAGNWKLIRTTRPELYDLANDPHELHDLAEINPVQRQALEQQLADFESRRSPRPGVEVPLSANELRALASLGYVGGGRRVTAVSEGQALPDIKDMLALNDIVEEAQNLINHGSLEAAIQRLGMVVDRSPAHTDAALALADALMENKQLDEAAAVVLKLLDVNPDARGAHGRLANLLATQERYDEAAVEYQKELEIEPLWVEAHFQLSRLAQRKKDFHAALNHLDAMIEIDATSTAAYKERGNLFAATGRVVEAIADYRRVLRFDPEDVDVEHRLGVLLSDRDAADARRLLQHAVQLAPDRAEYQFALGALLLREREYAPAVEHLTRALELSPDSPVIAERLRRAQQELRGDGTTPK
jgi:arylsulfatase A-like enzyme/Flp pilus assembly protein TadD